MKFSIILVNFNSQNLLEKCLTSVEKKLRQDKLLKRAEVLIMNNENKNLSLKKSPNLNLKIIENRKNLGFGRACNLGAKKAKGDILLFLNPDTKILKGSFVSIINTFQDFPKIGIIGTQVIERKTKLPQPWTCGKRTSLQRILFKKINKKPWESRKPTLVDWVSGTSLFIKKDLFNRLDGFDEDFFMYFEDQDLCLRVKKLEKRCLFFPEFSILHYDGKSWHSSKAKKENYYHSQDLFFKKHFNSLHYYLLIFFKKILRK